MSIEQTAADAAFAAFSVAATYSPAIGSPFSCRVVVDQNVEYISEQLITEFVLTLSFLCSEVASVKRNDTVTIGVKTYRLDRVMQDDGFIKQVIAV